jgi:hypothetical protein
VGLVLRAGCGGGAGRLLPARVAATRLLNQLNQTPQPYNRRIVWKHPAALTEPDSRTDGFRVTVTDIHTGDQLFSLSKYILGKLTITYLVAKKKCLHSTRPEI